MNWKYFILTAFSLYGIVFFVACGKNNSSDPVTYTCPTGTSYYNNGYCYNQYGQIIGTYGGVTAANVDTGYLAETQRNNNLSITDTGVFKNMLQKMFVVCDQNHINGGTASCDYWVGGYFGVMLQAFSSNATSARISFYVQPQVTMNGFNYYYSLPSFGQIFEAFLGVQSYTGYGVTRQFIPLDAVLSVTNANQGFEARTYGPLDTASNRSLIQLQVSKGKILDTTLPIKLSFDGKTFATGTLGRCINSNCNN